MFPDFLGIGAPRCGTSWLWENLRWHPDIWMPATKEIHYFDRLAKGCSGNVFQKLFGRPKHSRMWRRWIRKEWGKLRSDFDRQRFLWDLKYFFGAYNDAWYASLFAAGRGKVTGEITPSYSMLGLKDIKHIHDIMPEIKIIFLMRNPVDMVWSFIKLTFCNLLGNPVSAISLEEALKRAGLSGVALMSNYARTFKNWLTFFPEQQFFIGFFEEVKNDPGDFLLRIYKFLGVRVSREYFPGHIRQKVASSPQRDIPPELKKHLSAKYYPRIKELSLLFGSYPASWLKEAEAILDEPGVPVAQYG